MVITTICKRTKHLTMNEMPMKARGILRRMTDNPNFPDAGPLLAELEQRTVAMEAANVACLNRGRGETAVRKQCRRDLEATFDKLVGYVRYTTSTDVARALTSGFQLRRPPILLPVADPPQHVSARGTVSSGEILLRWKPRHGVRMYRVELNPDGPEANGSWQAVGVTKKAKFKLKAMESGRYIWLRVIAYCAAGTSAASAPARGMAC